MPYDSWQVVLAVPVRFQQHLKERFPRSAHKAGACFTVLETGAVLKPTNTKNDNNGGNGNSNNRSNCNNGNSNSNSNGNSNGKSNNNNYKSNNDYSNNTGNNAINKTAHH